MITQERLKELVSYHEESGCFIWNDNLPYVEGGKKVGWLRPDGYIGIGLDNKRYLAHRLIFLFKGGIIPNEIDHVDSNPSNNRWDNLRPCTRIQNSLNKGAYSNSKSGVKGVSWHKQRGKWTVRVMVEGKYKSFGLYDDIELAELVAMEAREKYHGEFANHGITNSRSLPVAPADEVSVSMDEGGVDEDCTGRET